MTTEKEGDKPQSKKLTQEEIAQCIEFLEALISNTNQIFEIPREMREALMMAAGWAFETE